MITGYIFKLDGKNLIWGGPKPPTWSLILRVCCTRSLLYMYTVVRENAERNWKKHNALLLLFFSLVPFQLEGGFTAPPGYAYDEVGS